MEKQLVGIDQPTSNLPVRGTTMFLATVVTFNVFLNILRRWNSYDFLGKSLSVVLMAILALLLVEVFWGRRGKRKLQPDTTMLFSYTCLLLTTSVFNYH